MTRTKINRVYMDAKDKNVATVLVFVNDNDELFYDKEFTVAVPEEDIKELYFKGSIFVKNERYYSPYNYDPTNNTIAWKPAESGSGLEEQEQADWNEDDGTKVSYIKNKPEFATVATSGSYNDLDDIPVFANVATSGSYNDLNNIPEFATVASTGNYTDLNGIPALSTIATSGNYNDLSNKPDIPAAQIPADWNQGNHLAPDYIKNKPTIPEAYTLPTASTETLGGVKVDGTTITIDNNGVISGNSIEQVPVDWEEEDSSSLAYIANKPTIPAAQIPSDWNQSDTEAVDYIKNKPTIPAAQVQVDWNQGNHAAIDYIKNKPTIPAAQIPADWEQDDSTALDYIKNKPTIPDAQVPADWNEDDSSSPAYILNKPTIPAAPVNPNWNETDSNSLAYIQNKPTIPAAQEQADWNEGNHNSIKYIKNKPTLGTASAKDFTASVTENSADLVTSGAVYSAINAIPEYTLPTSSTETLGGVKVDGTSITINEGVISSTQYSLPTASNETLGGVKVDGDTITIDNGVISANIPEIPEQEQVDWNEDDTTSASYIQNKPTIPDISPINANLLSDTEASDESGLVTVQANGSNLTSCTTTLQPIQDLHGYSSPWVGGAGKNLFDFESWLTARGVTYTKSGNAYTFNVSSLVGSSGAWTFSDTPINVTLTANITNVTSTNVGFRLKNGTDVSARGDNITMTATTVYLDWSTTGQVTIEEPMIRLSTITDPTFAPYSNICPISGYDSASYNRCGVNQWDEEVASGYYNANGEFVAGTNVASKNLIPCVGNTAYYFYGGTNANSQYRLCFYDINQDFIERTADSYVGTSFTTPINARYMTFYMELTPYGTTYNHDISINYPSTITTYQPYQAQNVTLTFDNTVYSGVIDWCNGVVTVDKAMVDLGTLTWNLSSLSANVFYKSIPTLKKINNVYIICSNYKYIGTVETTNELTSQPTGVFASQITFGEVYIKDTRYTDASTFTTAMDGVQLCYELATPTTIQLTPTQLTTLKGTNTISTPQGSISLTYQPDNVIGELKKSIDDVEREIPSVDSVMSLTSTNPLQNKVIASELQGNVEASTEGQVLTLSNCAGIFADDVSVDIEPVQDLHGYEYPWVGGAGKNLLPMTVDDIKAINTDGTWSGNTYTILSCTVTIMTDDGSNVTGFKINNAPTGNHANFYLASNITLSNDCVLSGGLGSLTIKLRVYSGTTVAYEDAGQGASVTAGSYTNVRIVINEGYNANNTIIYPMIRLATVTDASFAPYSNICPISGYDSASYNRCGVNQWDEVAESGRIDATTGTNVVDAGWIRSKNYIKVKPNTVYYFSIPTTYTTGRMAIYDENKNFIQWSVMSYNATYTMPQNAGYIRITFGVTTYNNDISINYPSTITSYEPYQGQTYTVEFKDDQDNPMTVYSGTLDVTTGVLTVDKGMVDLGDLTWTYNSSGQGTMQSQSINTSVKKPSTFDDKIGLLSSAYVNLTGNQAYGGTIGIAVIPNGDIWVHDTRYTDATTFKTAMDGVQLCYELATPQTIQLTPQQLQMLKGYNTVTTDANGGMTIKYQPNNAVGECKEYAQNAVSDGLNSYAPATIFDNKMVLFMGDSFMEGFGQKAADGLDSTSNPIITPANADASPMRGWAKTFAERYPRANVHNLGIYGATIAYQDNNPSFMGELVYMFNNNWQPDYVVFDGGANDIFQGITSGSATADDAYAVMNWDTFNYNTYQTIPCLEAIFSLFNSNSPTTRLLFIIPPEMSLNVTTEMKTNIDNMQTTIENVCAKWGVSTLRLTEKGSKNTIYSNNTDYYSASDKIHPMQRYYDETINRIISALEAM